MDVAELRQLVNKPEWADVELKTSARAFPKDAASTLCAFANCGGGYLILGVDEKKLPAISGIDKDKIDEVQDQCLGLLKNIQKFSSPLVYDTPSLISIDGKYVLVVQIQDSKRQNKPVKLREKGGWVAYVRNGARDEVANDEELAQMLLDANCTSITDQLLELNVEQCFNANTIKWYRKVFESRHNQKYYELNDLEFLDDLGLIREDGEELKPTKAAILMFGSEKSINHILARNVVDAFWFSSNFDDRSGTTRWQDRRPSEHESLNLFEAWRVLADRYMYWAEQPFDIDESNLHRNNETPDYIGFREATVNLLVHQDFADHTRVPRVEFYKDISQYWNPGDSLVEQGQIASGQSKSRNPMVMQTFHRIGLSERAGSGIKEIYRSWLHLDRPEPVIENSRREKTFQITLGKQPKVSPLQDTIRDKVGVNLTDLQARVFAAVLGQTMTVEALAEELNVSTADIYPATDYLARQSLLQALPEGYQAMDHFTEALADLQQDSAAQAAERPKETKLDVESKKSDQAGPLNTEVSTEKVTKLDVDSDQVERILSSLTKKNRVLIQAFDGQMGLAALMHVVNVSHRTHFKNKQLQPVINLGIVSELYSDSPNHPNQAYYLTDLGLALQEKLLESDQPQA
ncbi:putative DNA binding domain-containing protein [Gilvimarinus agarilyticus]|uniref:RNA-binding domain-containing protein n=1 Tax=Gilvimarinus sp. 2_MG-2023 TaxID=3062666 RepID=UPI001C095DC2|nr:RNA-binding domain-containing protein [Gilvimarinus sp. 2_MG-2023]MBU2886740.1 putative DNA binding domain-containing protein [Gilvimarinus agarilyticus]MDO6571405.1 putative DNA binding domain-containing protein [Gilvimarinus sp. 2_MG-2023]